MARSSAASGSSSSRISGLDASARASATRCRSPPERSATGLVARCAIPSRSTDRRRAGPVPVAASRTGCCAGHRDAETAGRPAARSRRAGARLGTSTPAAASKSTRPPIATRPRFGRRMPAITSSTDVLPEPDGPYSASARASHDTANSSRKLPCAIATDTSKAAIRPRGPAGSRRRRRRRPASSTAPAPPAPSGPGRFR